MLKPDWGIPLREHNYAGEFPYVNQQATPLLWCIRCMICDGMHIRVLSVVFHYTLMRLGIAVGVEFSIDRFFVGVGADYG